MAQQSGGLLMGFVLGVMAGGLAVHLYDTRTPSDGVSETAIMTRDAPTCADRKALVEQLANLEEQLKVVPPVIKGENGSADTPNHLYAALKSQIEEITATLKTLDRCPSP